MTCAIYFVVSHAHSLQFVRHHKRSILSLNLDTKLKRLNQRSTHSFKSVVVPSNASTAVLLVLKGDAFVMHFVLHISDTIES